VVVARPALGAPLAARAAVRLRQPSYTYVSKGIRRVLPQWYVVVLSAYGRTDSSTTWCKRSSTYRYEYYVVLAKYSYLSCTT
jgi:hypothetical protein